MTDQAITLKTEGQRQLLGVADPPRDICARTGAAKSLVSQWRAGTKRPGRAWREVLHRTYAIPIAAWDLRAGETPVQAQPDRQPEPSPPPPQAPPTAAAGDLAASALAAGGGTLASVNAHLARLERELATSVDLPARERHQLEQRYMAALRLKANIERDAELLEDRVVREHPAWRRTKAILLAALERHPDALRDVITALEAVGA